MKQGSLALLSVFAIACANTNCREARAKSGEPPPPIKKELDPLVSTAAADRVKVFKPDGSLQCGQGKAVAAPVMQKDLGGLRVYSSATKNDGMMRTQVCGAPTGNSNVYEIDRGDLAKAIKRGFREWTAE